MRHKLKVLSLVLTILAIPLISAYTWGYGNPMNYLENEWAKFAIVFLLLFLAVYTFFINRTQHNTAVSAIAGAGISLLLTMAIIKRGLFDSFLNENIVDYILIIAIIIGLFFIVYSLYKKLQLKGIIIGIIILALIPAFVDLEGILPVSIMIGPFGDFITLINSLSSIIIGIVILVGIIWLIKKIFFRKKIPRQNINVNVGGGGMSQKQIARARNKAAQQIKDARRAQINRGYYAPQKRGFFGKGKSHIN